MAWSKYQIDGDTFSDGTYNFSERDCCRHCRDEAEAENKPFAFGEDRYSFGVYAGRYCDECWSESGYRDATDPDAKFDRADAGEAYWEDEY